MVKRITPKYYTIAYRSMILPDLVLLLILGACGKTKARMRYGKNPGKPPGKNKMIKIIRGITGSMSKYSAMPPHTPAIRLSVVERYSRFMLKV